MSELPQSQPMTQEQAFAALQIWYAKKRELADLKTSEVLLRKDMAAFYFPTPQVGTNRMDLGGGYDLKMVFKYNITVDEAAVENTTAAQIKKLKLPWDDLFVYKPSLVKAVYDDLTSEQKKFVDGLLDIKEATPDLDIVPRANTAGAQKYIAAAQAEPEVPPAFIEVQDPEDAKPGNYYQDGDGQWWHMNAGGDWETCEDPNAPADAKPKGRRKKAK